MSKKIPQVFLTLPSVLDAEGERTTCPFLYPYVQYLLEYLGRLNASPVDYPISCDCFAVNPLNIFPVIAGLAIWKRSNKKNDVHFYTPPWTNSGRFSA